ncbi:MAG: membrane protein [Candidatus Hydrogenedentota bacterium]
MATKSSPGFHHPKNAPLLVAILFAAGLSLAIFLWPDPAPVPAAEADQAAADQAAAPEEQAAPTDPTDPSDLSEGSPDKSEATAPPDTGETFRVAGTVPVDNEVLENRIVVFFDKPIAVAGLNEEGALPPFTMTPPFQGSFTVGDNYLDLRLEEVPSDQIVTLNLGDAIRSKDGDSVAPSDRQLTFTPFEFEAQRVWSIESTADREVLGVLFPVPVTVETLREHASVQTAAGEAVPFTIEEGTSNTIQRLVIEGNESWPVGIRISSGLSDETGVLTLQEPQDFTYPTELELAITNVTWETIEDSFQRIGIEFTKGVRASDLEEHLKIANADSGEPVSFELDPEVQGTTHFATVHLAEPARTSLTLAFSAGLAGAERSELTQNISRKLVARSSQEWEPLLFEDQWWNQEGREGLVLNLGFNQKVEPQDLKEFLRTSREIPDLRIEPAWNNRRVRVYGQWDSEATYEFTLASGMPYGDGFKLEEDLSRTITTDKVPPFLGFGQDEKYYFPRRSGLNLPIDARGVREVRVSLHRMFPSNIAVAISDINDGEPWYRFMESWSEFLTKNEMDVAFSPNRLTPTPLALDSLIPAGKQGVFALEVEDISPLNPEQDENADDYEYYDYDRRAQSARKLILFTNIGVMSHWLDDELVVFAHDLYSLQPLDLAKVTVYSHKNQILGTTNTDAQGMAQLEPFDTALGRPTVVVVEKGDDYTFLELQPRNDDITEQAVEMPPFDRDGYDAFLYADRELYRPGEPVHLRWIVRTNYGDALPNVPLMLTVTKPNGQELLNQPSTLSELGTGGMDIETQKSYPTGKYLATLKVPDTNSPLGTYSFSVEEFVPNRIKAEVTLAEEQWLAGQEYTIKVNAQHFFGAPAADRKSEAKIVLRPATFRPEQWKGFTFGNDSEFATDIVSTGEGTTDASGDVTFPFTYEAPPNVSFPLNALVVGRVFELGGRAVAGTKEVTLFPSENCLGILANTPEGGRGVEVTVAAITPGGEPAALDTVKVTLEKQVWNYYVRRYYDYHQPNWSESFEPIETREVSLTEGTGSTTFNFGSYGYYRVRVHSDATPQYSTLSFYSYGGDVNLVDSARPSLIKLTLDKKSYTVGEEATVRIEAPFDGTGFVVVQGEEIQRIETVEIKDGAGTASFMLTRDQYPNVWIEATVVHAIKEGRDQVYPFSSFAMQSIEVEDPRRSIAITYPDLPEEIRPAQQAQFTVKTTDGDGNPASVEVTLAAVDEGIHSITGYKSPAPVEYLSRPRRADYRRAHYYDKVAYDFEKTPIGGDLEALLGKRAAAVDENWIKPVALWSGVVQTDADGLATVTMDVPEFSGQLRLVAVAASEKAAGAETSYVYVRRPYTLRTSMPRFLLPGDRSACRAVLFNNTDDPCTAALTWSSEGTLVDVTGSQEVDVPAHGEASLLADFSAAEAIGQGAINWSVVFKDANGAELEKVEEHAPVPVRTPAVYQTHHELHALKPGESVTIANTMFLDDARAMVDVTVSANPQFRLQEALKYVVGYPYGCVEQTTSRLMPMYLLKQNAGLVDMTLHKEQTLDMYIQSGIDRLFAMQTESGGLGFWPGAESPYRYGSIYALHFLTLVKNGREYKLPEKNLEALEKFVRRISEDWSGSSQSSLYERAYAIYVLSIGGDLEAIKQIGRFDDVTLPRASRLLLAAALARNTQDTDRVKLYLSNTPSEPYAVTEQGGTLNSDIRNTAVELFALQQIEGTEKERAEKAEILFAFLRDHRHGNTQETAFIVTALSGYLADLAKNADKAAATITGSAEGQLTANEVYHRTRDGAGGTFTINNTGGSTIFVNGTTGGIPENPDLSPIAEKISVARSVFTSTGEPFGDSAYRQSDSYVIGIELKCDQDVENLVVADLIPAGFEIENPRLEPDAIPTGPFDGAATPSHLEIRDDRLVVAFDELERGTHKFYYIARAVTPGTYQYPAVEAECMYDASVHGRGESGTVEVVKR